jgi:hypothetical protein
MLLVSTVAAAIAAVASLVTVADTRRFRCDEDDPALVDRLLAVHAVVAEIKGHAAGVVHGHAIERHIVGSSKAALAACSIPLPTSEHLAVLESDRHEDFLVVSEDAIQELRAEIALRG